MDTEEGLQVEYGVRDVVTDHVTYWGGENFLALSEPRNFPGYTIVTRTVSPWEPLHPIEGSTHD